MNIPEWVWKVLSILILPIFLWAIGTHMAVSQDAVRISQLEQKISQTQTVVETQKENIYATQKDIEILKVRMDYIAQGIDDIKNMLKKD